jgi:hypothetical protein
VAQVAAILRARTYSDSNASNTYEEVVGGEELGTFNDKTRPTGDQVEELIDLAVADVSMRVAASVPVSLEGPMQRVAALRAACEVERSYIPEQSEGAQSVYQTLRLTYEEEVEKLGQTMQWFVLANRLEAEASAE